MKKLFMFMLTAIILALSGFSQEVVTIGLGNDLTNNNRVPIHLWFNYSASQTIYLADDIEQTGNITSIAYYMAASGVNSTRQIKVYMATTSMSSFPTAQSGLPASDFTLVYQGPWTVVSSQWSEIELDEPFPFDGSENLVIALEETTGSYLGNSKYWRSTNVANRFVAAWADGSPQTIGALDQQPSGGYPDVQLTILPAGDFCSGVRGLATTNVTSSTATLSWEEREDTPTFYYQIKTANEEWPSEDEYEETNDYSISFEDLSPATTYNVRVMADCGDLQSGWRTVVFTTSCAELTTLPYFCDFETVGTGSNPIPNCWTKGSASTYPYTYTSNTYQGSRTLYFYNPNYIAMPPIDVNEIDLTETQVSFYAKAGTNGSVIQVGVMTDPANANTFTLMETINLTNTYTLYEVPFSTYEDEGAYIAFKNIATANIYVDNVTIEPIPECSRPGNLTVSNLSESSVTLSWASTGTNFEVYLQKNAETSWSEAYTDFTQGEGDGVWTISLEDLDIASTYHWYVKALCDDGTTPSSSTSVFQTPCATISIPYTYGWEDVEGSVSGGGSVGTCWTRSSGTDPYIGTVTSNAHTGVGYLYFSTPNIVSLPPVDTEENPINTLQIRFWSKNQNTSNMQIGVMTNPSDVSTFELLESISLTSTYTEYEVSLADYEGTGAYVAFKVPSGYGYLDDIALEQLPACSRPQSLSANPSTDEAVLSWTSTGEEFTVYYKTAAEITYNQAEATLDEDGTFTLTGLNPATTYTWYVVASCDGTTPTSSTSSFTTLCDAISVSESPWSENFDNYANYVVPNCWTVLKSYAYSSSAIYPSVDKQYSSMTSKNILFNSGSSTTWIALPLFADDLNTLRMTCNVYPAATNSGTLQIGVLPSLSISDTANFELVETLVASNTAVYPTVTWTPLVVDFNNITTESGFIAIKHIGLTSSQEWEMDDLVIKPIPACSEPTSLNASNITGESASLSWNSNASSFILYYKEASDNEYTAVEEELTEGVYNLTDLTPTTSYSWYVTSVCDDGTLSASSISSFTTACAAISSLPYSWDFENNNTAGTSSYPLPACWERINSQYYP
ncbi:MAG: fibronectin type III domain-containing protein, partial [Bacteroidales bacterium]|nr:fibronectin type III domain-containing protein [Bacteroidales bacterium]